MTDFLPCITAVVVVEESTDEVEDEPDTALPGAAVGFPLAQNVEYHIARVIWSFCCDFIDKQ